MARRSGITEIKQKSIAKWVLINGIKFNEREEIQRCHHERDLKCFFSVSALEKKHGKLIQRLTLFHMNLIRISNTVRVVRFHARLDGIAN
jgi:hypothetical protein